MPYDVLPPAELYSRPRPKPKKLPRLLMFLFISVILQVSFFYGVNKFFHQLSGTDIEPDTVTEVRERSLALSPTPDTPANFAISPDRSKLALSDSDQIRVYDLKSGREILYYPFTGQTLGSLQWLPDRNRLIFALLDTKQTSQFVRSPVKKHKSGVMDETYSTDTYRENETPASVAPERFQIAVYSLEGSAGAEPEHIQTLKEAGPLPEQVELSFSTYTNLLFVHWKQANKDKLAQIDIMNRIKDYRLPKGELTKLVVSPQSGTLWAEFNNDNSPEIYTYHKGRWRVKTYLDGYRLLGATPDDQLAVATDQDDQTREIQLVNEKEDFKPGWTFTEPIKLKNVVILNDGRLMYIEDDHVVIHTAKRGEGTLFTIDYADSYSPDGKMVIAWQRDQDQLKIMEEVTQAKTE